MIKTISMIKNNKRIFITLPLALVLLLIPLIAIQFTDKVNWKLFDFVIGGALLIGISIAIDFVIHKTKSVKYHTAMLVALLIVFLLVWAELAVGIFGTPFSGN